jgi:hypothetical protein
MDRRGVRPGDGRQSPRRAARRWSAADGKTPAALLPYVQSRSFDPFFQGLRELGYVNGHTITIDYLSADGQVEKFPTLAADCLRLKADIIVATTTLAAQAAKNATRTTPIVMHGPRRPGGERARREPRQAWGECHRGVNDVARACSQASRVAERGAAPTLASARAHVDDRPEGSPHSSLRSEPRPDRNACISQTAGVIERGSQENDFDQHSAWPARNSRDSDGGTKPEQVHPVAPVPPPDRPRVPRPFANTRPKKLLAGG